MVRDSGVPEFVIGDGGLWQTCPKNRSPLGSTRCLRTGHPR
jgi:hypothetical protein